jgi:hypothetical protein
VTPSGSLFRECGCRVDFGQAGQIRCLAFCYECARAVDIQWPLPLPLAYSDNAAEPEPEEHHAQNQTNSGEATYRRSSQNDPNPAFWD